MLFDISRPSDSDIKGLEMELGASYYTGITMHDILQLRISVFSLPIYVALFCIKIPSGFFM